MRRTLATLVLLLAAPAGAANIAYCDTQANPILGRVLNYERSVDTTPELVARHGVDVVINPDVSALSGVPVRYWRCNAVPAVIEMNQTQKNAMDAFFDLAGETSAEEACKVTVALDPAVRAAFLVVLEQWVNPLRELHSLAPITRQEGKTAYDSMCESILEGGGGGIVAAVEGQPRRTQPAGGGRE